MTATTRRRALVAIVALAAVAAVVVAPSDTDDRTVEAAGAVCDTDCGAGGEFHPITPFRVYDSRLPSPRSRATGPTKPSFSLEMSGKGGLPRFVDADGDGLDDNVLALAVNATITSPSGLGHVTAYGKGERPPEASILNFTPGSTVANSAVLRPGQGGELTFQIFSTSPGRTHFVLDVMGWYSTSAHPERGARTLVTAPIRLADSREDGARRPLGTRGQRAIEIQDSSAYRGIGVDFDADDVAGVLINLTAVNRQAGSAETYLTATPSRVPDGTEATTSNLNIGPQDTRAAMAFVPLGRDNKFWVFNRWGSTHVVVDLMAVLVEGRSSTSRLGRVVPLVAPFRAFDTRKSAFGAKSLGAGQAETWDFSDFVADVKISGDWVGNQAGVIGNLTGLLSRQYSSVPVYGHITFFPTRSNPRSVPNTSNLNLADGQTVPNMTVTKFGGGTGNEKVSAFNSGGRLHYLYDVSAVILAN